MMIAARLPPGGCAVGNIEQRGDEEVGLALEDHFANAKSIGLRFADEFGVERRALRAERR